MSRSLKEALGLCAGKGRPCRCVRRGTKRIGEVAVALGKDVGIDRPFG
jgi:hypothetical protein